MEQVDVYILAAGAERLALTTRHMSETTLRPLWTIRSSSRFRKSLKGFALGTTRSLQIVKDRA